MKKITGMPPAWLVVIGLLAWSAAAGSAFAFTIEKGKVVFNWQAPFHDSMTLAGSDWRLIPGQDSGLTLQLGPYQQTLSAFSFSPKGSKLIYSRPHYPGIRKLSIDTATGKFKIQAKGLYLWELLNPFAVAASVGDEQECIVFYPQVKSKKKWTFLSERGDIQSQSCGKVSGAIGVPPNNLLEQEPNQDPHDPRVIPGPGYSLAGYAGEFDESYKIPDPDYPGDWIWLQDLFKVTLTEPSRVTLTMGADNLRANDLDLFVLDSWGTSLLQRSEGLLATEMVEIQEPGTYLLGVSAYKGASSYVLSVESTASGGSTFGGPIPPDADFVPGEVLVKRKPSPKSGKKVDPGVLGLRHGLVLKKSLPPEVEIFQVDTSSLETAKKKSLEKGKPVGDERELLKRLTLEAIRRLRLDPEVEYAEPNYIRRPLLTPNDTYFGYQWHYDLIGLPQAWDVTTGSDEIIVAVLDTGILSLHPDLAGRLVSGYDFVSITSMANDGDGIDPDPEDPGDDPEGFSSSFHGTHVAGTIGAATNNSIGVAGVTWRGKIMPIRVLGVGGGTDSDIAQGIRYAAGLSNASGTLPQKRAHIINTSLGGPGYNQTLLDAVRAARDQGVIILAAAGNSNTSTFFYPAAYQAVVAVSAVDASGQKAPYSNYGDWIDVAAPGGNVSVDLTGDGYPDGVLSTLANQYRGAITSYNYVFYQGTSMACPHMAGVVALMLAVNPEMTPADLDSLLAGNHASAPGVRITKDIGAAGKDDLYGHGLIDTPMALAAAQAIIGSPGVSGSVLSLSTNRLNFDTFLETLYVDVSNRGSGTLTVNEVTGDQTWINVTPTSGIAPLRLTISVDRSGLSEGDYSGRVTVFSDATQGDPVASVEVSLKVSSGALKGEVGTLYVLAVDPETYYTVAEAVTDSQGNYLYLTPFLPQGEYLFFAGTDRDEDGWICDTGEACGYYPDPVQVSSGATIPNIDFLVANMVNIQSARVALKQTGGRGLRRIR